MIKIGTNTTYLRILGDHGFDTTCMLRDNVIVVRLFGCGVRKPIKDALGLEITNIHKQLDLTNKEDVLRILNRQVLKLTETFVS